ncbi:hypothetical protein [Microcoleus sp. herbarium12]|uniref:hypothetical protein n=1 Tax=Microcoleus sp. herbarium12 TaxID=3055437 RepID=UPI002FD69B42
MMLSLFRGCTGDRYASMGKQLGASASAALAVCVKAASPCSVITLSSFKLFNAAWQSEIGLFEWI